MRTALGFLILSLAFAGCSSEVETSTLDGTWSGVAGAAPRIEITPANQAPSRVDTLGPLGACVTGTVVAEARPSTLQMVVDTSGSMQWPPGWDPNESASPPPPSAPSKWQITKGALDEVVSELHADTALGVTFFPNLAHSGSSCIKNEVALPIQPLGAARSEQRQRFRRALSEVEPRGGTPTHCAFQFGTQKLTATTAQGNRFLLLITDGTPTYTLDCAGDGRHAVDSSPLVADAARLRTSADVLTFVIGSAGSEEARSVLSRLARAGGTGAPGCSDEGPSYCHFDMTNGTDLAGALQSALATISKRITSCEYPVPAAPAGQSLDRGRVNVVYTPEGGTAEIIPQDVTDTCAEGWRYTADGERVVLCGQSCSRVKSELRGEVELFFGCATQQAAPR